MLVSPRSRQQALDHEQDTRTAATFRSVDVASGWWRLRGDAKTFVDTKDFRLVSGWSLFSAPPIEVE